MEAANEVVQRPAPVPVTANAATDHESDKGKSEQPPSQPSSPLATSPALAGEETIADADADVHANGNADADADAEQAAAAPEEEDEKPPRSRMRLTAIVVAIYLACFFFAFDATMVSTALPTISKDLDARTDFAWVSSVYLLASAAGNPLWSNWSDIWGRKHVMNASIVVFSVGCIVCALAPSITILIVGRAIQGFGGGGSLILVYVILSDIFSMRMRSLIFGMMEVVWATAGGAGPVIGGAIAENIGWRWVFWINLPFTGIAFALILIFLNVHVPRTSLRQGIQAIDWIGGLAIAGMTVMLLLGLNFGGQAFPWNSAVVICLIVFGLLLFPVFLFAEKRLATYPILPMHIYSDASNLASLVATMMQSMVVLMSNYYLPLYFQSVRDASPLFSGVLVIPFELAEAIVAFLVGIIISRSGRYNEVIWFSTILMTLGAGLFIDLTADASLGKVIAYLIVIGIGTGGLFQPYILAVQARVPQNDQAAATSALGFARLLAGAVALVVGGVVFQNGMLQQRPTLLAAGLAPALVEQFTGGDAVGSALRVGQIPDAAQRQAVRVAYAQSIRNMWIVMAACAAVGLLCSFFIQKAELSTEHTETKTGLNRDKVGENSESKEGNEGGEEKV